MNTCRYGETNTQETPMTGDLIYWCMYPTQLLKPFLQPPSLSLSLLQQKGAKSTRKR